MSNLDIHLTRLVGWYVRLIGRALAIAAAVTLGLSAVFTLAFANNGVDVLSSIGWAALLGTLVFAVQLTLASAPEPLGVDDED